MSFKPYEDYKETGVDWVGPIPTVWSIVPLKRAFTVALGKMLQPERRSPTDRLGQYLRAANIQWVGIDDTEIKEMWFSEVERQQLKLVSGDLLVSEGGDVGRSCLWRDELEECFFQNSVNRVRALGENSTEFLRYWMWALKEGGFVDVLCNRSTIAHFTAEKVSSVPVALPPPSDQYAIASFLDRETAKIDALVAAQEKLIELLTEKRQAVISQAVRRGLNTNAPMKDSGIEWLGEVPAHWEVGALKRFWAVIDCKHVTAEFVDDGLPLASIREVQGRFVDLSTANKTTEAFYALMIEGGREPQAGDLIFSRNATVGEVAQVASWHPQFAMGQDVCLLRKLSAEYSSDFLQGTLRSTAVANQLALLMIGSTFKRVNVEEIRSLIVPMPPEAEQADISSHITNETEKFDNVIKEAATTISLLKERRSALISAAVTGKIDVLGFNMPETQHAALEPA